MLLSVPLPIAICSSTENGPMMLCSRMRDAMLELRNRCEEMGNPIQLPVHLYARMHRDLKTNTREPIFSKYITTSAMLMAQNNSGYTSTESESSWLDQHKQVLERLGAESRPRLQAYVTSQLNERSMQAQRDLRAANFKSSGLFTDKKPKFLLYSLRKDEETWRFKTTSSKSSMKSAVKDYVKNKLGLTTEIKDTKALLVVSATSHTEARKFRLPRSDWTTNGVVVKRVSALQFESGEEPAAIARQFYPCGD